jgi:hypothetical protein
MLAFATIAATGAKASVTIDAPDPIFAAIEAYKKAVATQATAKALLSSEDYNKKYVTLVPHPRYPPEDLTLHLWDSLSEARSKAFDAIFTTEPTTIAGVAAQLDQLATLVRNGYRIMSEHEVLTNAVATLTRLG